MSVFYRAWAAAAGARRLRAMCRRLTLF